MNREETWALYQQGKDAWNAWAAEMLAKRKAMEDAGEWAVDESQLAQNEATKEWFEAAEAVFRARDFENIIEFDGIVFPGLADFRFAKFLEEARFIGVHFLAGAHFRDAVFNNNVVFLFVDFYGEADFFETEFRKGAIYKKVKFLGDADFGQAKFLGPTQFDQTKFNKLAGFYKSIFDKAVFFSNSKFLGNTTFVEARFAGSSILDDADFQGYANFRAVNVESAFWLSNSVFREVPSFIQADFAQAPRLDDCRFGLFDWSVRGAVQFFFGGGDEEHSARWRALKKLASEVHDHESEQKFFAHELKTRRWNRDWPWQPVFWFAWIYQLLSGFGRSFVRPIIWVLLTTAVFGCLYLGNHRAYVDDDWAGFSWGWAKFTSYFDDREVEPEPCVVSSGNSNAYQAAILLTLRNTIPFAGLGAPEKLNQIYRCLYGVEGAETAGFPETRLPPHIPDRIVFYNVLQAIISAVLIFLFLLAVRNHFRIK